MDREALERAGQARPARRSAKPGLIKRGWRRLRAPLARSRLVKNLLAASLAQFVRLTSATNPRVEAADDPAPAVAAYKPAIVALWHGQHLMAPTILPKGLPMVALFSRSADAELNALVAERLGFGIVRGSGGRAGTRVDKGGASALIALKKALDRGTSVAMIADIPHGKPREAGLGIVTLAKLSGRPIVPIAVATSRRKVIEKSWDKTTVNLPFGRSGLAIGEAIEVSADAGPEELEKMRRKVTAELNRATERAYAMVDAV